jgi:hypothetical protein
MWLALLLSGCGTLKSSSPLPLAQVQVPSPPAELMEPEAPSGSYSEAVLLLLQTWAKKLTDWRSRS